MTFKVEYTTDVRPTDLPAGAVIERIPTTFPVTIDTGISRKFVVEKAWSDDSAFLSVSETGSYGSDTIQSRLSKEKARAIALALLEAIGEGPAEPFFKGDKVKVTDSGHYRSGLVGTVEEELDDDNEIYVRFDDRSASWLTPDQISHV